MVEFEVYGLSGGRGNLVDQGGFGGLVFGVWCFGFEVCWGGDLRFGV